jgi:antitoxin component of MazEF toxin-antitoxin module
MATIIKIGDSAGITLPAKELKRAGLKPGDAITYSYESIATDQAAADAHTVEVVELTQKLIARHKKALDNLSQR